jgi:hypothetical protein
MHKSFRAYSLAALFIDAILLFSLSANGQEVKKELEPPATEQELLRVRGEGVQIYSCKADGTQPAWMLKAPEAELIDKDGKPFGKHFAGPAWQSIDGSQITGKAAKSLPSPDAKSIPWLLVTVIDRSGEGVLSGVTFIQRLDTKGGKAPAAGCDAAHVGQEARVPYSADYVFFVPNRADSVFRGRVFDLE